MSAARLASAALAFAACALYGAVRRARSGERLERLSGLAGDIGELRSLIASQRLPLPDALRRLRGTGRERVFWEQMSALAEEGLSFGQAYERCFKPDLGAEAAGVMEGLAEGLGLGDADTEDARLGHAHSELCRILEAEREASVKSGRLTSSLSLLSGLAAALLIL